MKNFNRVITIAILLFSTSCMTEMEKLDKKLKNLEDAEITEIPKDLSGQDMIEQFKVVTDSQFKASYEILFTQPVDHKNPESQKFKQRVIYSHAGFDRPTVVILEGYSIYSGRKSELTKMLDANQIVIEHRFFDQSRPDSIPWEYLTVWQAATDQHKIIKAFKDFYKGPFITTGISKGGQTTMYHKRFYPEDADVSVPYVAPLNFSYEEPRVYDFLEQVGSKECREKIYNFQLQLFENKEELMPMVKALSKENKWEFKMGIDRAFDLSILEYPFAFWQWGTPCESVPPSDAGVKALFNHWKKVGPITFFEENSIEKQRPFFYQSMTEVGMYGYKVEPFSEYLTDTTNIIFGFTMPEGVEYEYDFEAMKDVKEWLDKNGNNMLYLYGEFDPWSASAYRASEETNSVTLFNPGYHHGTRIRNLPDSLKDSVYVTLEKWLNMELNEIEN